MGSNKESKQKQYKQALKLISAGSTVEEACAQSGISFGTFYRWKRGAPYQRKKLGKGKRRKSSVQVYDLPVASPAQVQPLFMFYGTPSALLELQRAMR